MKEMSSYNVVIKKITVLYIITLLITSKKG